MPQDGLLGNIAITVIDLGSRRTNGAPGENAFHEKAGRSQVGWFCFLLHRFFLPPSSHCRHASIRTLGERFVSLGARWASSFQPVLLSVWRPVVLLFESGPLGQALDAVTGTRLWLLSFPFVERFWGCFCRLFYAAAATVIRLLLCNGSYSSPLTQR